MAWTAQEYLDRMAQTRSAHLKNIDTTGKRIQGIYAQAAKDLARRAAAAKDGSLTKRWQEEYQKALEQRVAQMRIELGNTVTGAMRKSARLPGETIEGWLDDALAMCGAEGSFSGVFSKTPDDVLRALLDGRMYRDGKSLSRRIWNATDQLQGNIEEIVAQGIAQKRSALNIARDLEAYVNPKAKMPVSWLKLYPSIPFDRQIDYNAQRLARTAINHAYWAANVETALANPFCSAIHWQLSPSHYERQVARFGEDVCDAYASHDEGLGRGNFPIKNVPMPHAQCLCVQVQVVPELDDVADRLSRWVDGGADPALDKAFGAWKSANDGPDWSKKQFTIKAPPTAQQRTQTPAQPVPAYRTQQWYFSDGTSGRNLNYLREALVYTEHGVDFAWQKGYTNRNQRIKPDMALRLFGQMPDKLKKQVDRVEFVTYRNPKDSFWEKNYGMRGFRSFATGGGRRITFYKNGDIPYAVTDAEVLHTFCHESGHNLDQTYAPAGSRWFSDGQTWKDAQTRDKAVSGKEWVSRYATTSKSVHEDFADSVAAFVTDNANFVRDFPERARIIGGML